MRKNKSFLLKNRFLQNIKPDRHIVFKRQIPFCSPFFWKQIFLFKKSFVFKSTKRKIFIRSSIIPYSYTGLIISIYSGKRWHKRLITPWMVGFKFGEFTWNRKLALYKAKQLKKLKKKKKINEIWTTTTNLLS